MNEKIKFNLKYLDTLNELVEHIIGNENADVILYDDFKNAMLSLGLPRENYMIELIDELKTDRSKISLFSKLFSRWLDMMYTALGDQIKSETQISKAKGDFYKLLTEIKTKSLDDLVQQALQCLKNIKDKNPSLYEKLTIGYRGWYFENNWLDGLEGGNNSLIYNRLSTLKNNCEKIEWLYNKLCDTRSKQSLNALLKSWLFFSMDEALEVAIWSSNVVNREIYNIYDDEVFVDCGSYTGDTVLELISETGLKYKKIYTYDISESTVEQMKKVLGNLPNIVYNLKGVSNNNGYLSFSGYDQPFHGNKLVEGEGTVKVPIVKLDDDIKEPITFLKIDVEGLDKEAILGAQNHIVKYHPKIHVDTYHKLVDFFEVPLLISKIDPTYKFYLRLPNSIEQTMMFCISCIYAV